MVEAAKRPTRAIFVGAGFSIPLGYPSGAQLPHELIRRLSKAEKDNSLRASAADRSASKLLLADLNTFMHRYLRPPGSPPFGQGGSADPLDVAEFYSVAQALSETPELLISERQGDPKGRSAGRLRTLYPRIAAATRTYFTDIIQNGFDDFPADMRALVKAIDRDRHVIVDFNWDEEIDWALTTGSGEVAYTKGAWRGRSTGLLLKPHGSINWYDLAQGVYNDDVYFVAAGDERLHPERRRLIAYSEIERPFRVGRRSLHGVLDCPPAIAPPTFAKRFSYAEQQLIWQDVISVCSKATEFLFLGYRVPKDDFLTRAALRAARDKSKGRVKVLVVIKDNDPTEILKTFGSIFGPTFSANNILNHQFGTGGKGFAQDVERRLAQAKI